MMTKGELTTQLNGAIVFHKVFGQGVVVNANAKEDNFIIDVQFAQDIKSYAAFIVIEKGIVSFSDVKYYSIVQDIKAIYDEEKKHKETIAEMKTGSRNNDIVFLVECLKSGESITHRLIELYNNVDFEKDLFDCGSEMFFKRMNGDYLPSDDLYVIILYLSYIALKNYDGEFHGKVVESISSITKRSIDANTARNTFYGIIDQLKIRETVHYFNPNSYVAVPICIACVPHYRVGQLFRIAYDIYKKKLLFNEDITDKQISEKVSEALNTLKRKNYISKTSEDVIKGTEYLMSKYTQSCIWSGYNLDALIGIITYSIRLIINYLTKQEDAYIVLDFYKDGFKKWIESFESDSVEKEAYLLNKSLSSPSLIMRKGYQIYLKTGAFCMDDEMDPHKVIICLYNGDNLIQKYKLDGPNDIEYNDDAIGGYKINKYQIQLPQNCSPINKLKYCLYCDEILLYDSQERLYREVIFFRSTDGSEAKPGTDHIGEQLIVISQKDNSELYGNKLMIISNKEQYIVSQIMIEKGDSYIFDDMPYIFRKIKVPEFCGYQVPWINFFSMEKKYYPIYKNVSVLLPASCDKEDVVVIMDNTILNFYNNDYRIYKYSQNNDGCFVYLIKIFNVVAGYHQISFKNGVTQKDIGKKKITFILDEELRKENLNYTCKGQEFNLVSSFLKDNIFIDYPFGISLIKEKAFVPNLGYGEFYIIPSSLSYSLDDNEWIDIYKPLSLYEISSTQNYILICGPAKMSMFYVNGNGKKVKLDFEKIDDNKYKLPLSYIRTQEDKKPTVCFDYGNTNKQLKIYREPWISNISCLPSDDGQYYKVSASFTTSKTLWLVIKSSADEFLLEKKVYSNEVVLLDNNKVGAYVSYINISIHSHGKSLFERYLPNPIKSYRYIIPNDIIISEDTNFYYNDKDKMITGQVFFQGEQQLKISVYPTGIKYLLYRTVVSNGDKITIGVKHGLFASYIFIFESCSETVKRINKKRYQVKAQSEYLKKTFNIEQFIFCNGQKENVSGFLFKFSEKYIILDKAIYAIGEIIYRMNKPHLSVLKINMDQKINKTFDIYSYNGCEIDANEIKRYKIKGVQLKSIKLKG